MYTDSQDLSMCFCIFIFIKASYKIIHLVKQICKLKFQIQIELGNAYLANCLTKIYPRFSNYISR